MVRGRWWLSLCVLLAPFVSHAATYYVAPSGTDSAPCTQTQPCQSLNRGVRLLGAGDTLYLRGGTYNPGAIGQHGTGTVASGTSWSNAVTIAAAPGETVWLTGPRAGVALVSGEAYIIFDGLRINASGGGNVFVWGGHHIRFQRGEICCGGGNFVSGTSTAFELLDTKLHGAGIYPVYWSGSDSLFAGNEVVNNDSYGFHIYGSGSNSVSHNRVCGNTFRGNGFHDPRGYLGCAVIVATGSANEVSGNLVEGNGCGIQVDYRCVGCVVRANTLVGQRAIAVHIGPSAAGTRVEDNLLSNNGQDVVNWGDGTAVLRNNGPTARGQTAAGACQAAPPVRPPLPAPRNVRLAPAG